MLPPRMAISLIVQRLAIEIADISHVKFKSPHFAGRSPRVPELVILFALRSKSMASTIVFSSSTLCDVFFSVLSKIITAASSSWFLRFLGALSSAHVIFAPMCERPVNEMYDAIVESGNKSPNMSVLVLKKFACHFHWRLNSSRSGFKIA